MPATTRANKVWPKRIPHFPHGTLDLLVLRTRVRGPNHGYGILLRVHETSNNLLRIEEGPLYPALHRLETSGLLTASWRISDNNRRAKYYSLTTRGRRQLADEQPKWEQVADGLARVLQLA